MKRILARLRWEIIFPLIGITYIVLHILAWHSVEVDSTRPVKADYTFVTAEHTAPPTVRFGNNKEEYAALVYSDSLWKGKLVFHKKEDVTITFEAAEKCRLTLLHNDEVAYTGNLSDVRKVTLFVKAHDEVKMRVSADRDVPFSFFISPVFELNRTLRNHLVVFLFVILFFLYGGQKVSFQLIFLLILGLNVFAEKVHFGVLYEHHILFYTAIAGVAVFALLLFSFFKMRRWIKVVLSVVFTLVFGMLALIPMLFIGYYNTFGFRLRDPEFSAIFQSNPSESMEFLGAYISPIWLLGAGLILVVFLCLTSLALRRTSPPRYWAWTAFMSVFTLLLAQDVGGNFYTLPQENLAKYEASLSEMQKIQDNYKTHNDLEVQKTGEGETYIVVIGESMSKDIMSLYGYHRQTTPLLDSMALLPNFVKANYAYSCHTHTAQVLQHALSEANQLNGKNYLKVPSVINYLKAAGFETHWVSNQGKSGEWNAAVSVIADACDSRIFDKNAEPDEILLPYMKNLLKQKTGNRVIFVHLMGSHFKYHKRYPDSWSKFAPHTISENGNRVDITKLPAYENSILYTDYVLTNIIGLLETEVSGNTALLFFADHAEDMLHTQSHNASEFTYDMTQIPMFMWFSDEYMASATEDDVFKKNSDSLFCNDMIFDAILGITKTRSVDVNPQYCITDVAYTCGSEQQYTLRGEKQYTTSSNPYYQSYVLNKEQKERNVLEKIIAKECNTLGKMYQCSYQGIHLVEVDATLYGDESKFTIKVGKEANVTEQDVAYYARHAAKLDGKIWLNIHGLTADNGPALVSYLDSIKWNKTWTLAIDELHVGVSSLLAGGYMVCYQSTSADTVPWNKIAQYKVKNIAMNVEKYEEITPPLGYQYHLIHSSHGILSEEFVASIATPVYRKNNVVSVLASYPSDYDY